MFLLMHMRFFFLNILDMRLFLVICVAWCFCMVYLDEQTFFILMWVVLFMSSFRLDAFYILFKKSPSMPRWWQCAPIWSSESFILLSLLTATVHLELFCLWFDVQVLSFSICICRLQKSQFPLKLLRHWHYTSIFILFPLHLNTAPMFYELVIKLIRLEQDFAS